MRGQLAFSLPNMVAWAGTAILIVFFLVLFSTEGARDVTYNIVDSGYGGEVFALLSHQTESGSLGYLMSKQVARVGKGSASEYRQVEEALREVMAVYDDDYWEVLLRSSGTGRERNASTLVRFTSYNVFAFKPETETILNSRVQYAYIPTDSAEHPVVTAVFVHIPREKAEQVGVSI